MTATPDDIALLVQTQYDALPPKRKPVVRDNGLHEWVPLSGIVAEGTTPPTAPQVYLFLSLDTINLTSSQSWKGRQTLLSGSGVSSGSGGCTTP